MRLIRTRSAARGFTLIELMVTMGIMAMLLGLGATMFLSLGRRSAEQQAIAGVSQIVTRARNASNRYPATIVPAPKEGMIRAFTDEVLQELHFDPRPTADGKTYTPMGIEGLDCQLMSGTLDDKGGRVGGAAKLGGGSVNCGNFAAYDVDQGISAEAWIKPSGGPKCDLVSKGRTLLVRFADTKSGQAGRVTTKLQLQHPNATQEALERTTNLPPIRANEWFGLRVSFDRRELVVSSNDGYGWVVQDRMVFSKPEDVERTLARDAEAPLVVAAGLNGWLDDVRVGGIRSAEPVTMPRGMEVLPGRSIRFVNGRLDPVLHSGVEVLSVKAEGQVMDFKIGQDGTILTVDDRAAGAEPVEKKVVVVPTEKKE